MYYRIVFNNVPLVGFKDSLTRNFRTFYLLYDMKNWTYLTPSILENADFWNVFTKRNFLNSHICYILLCILSNYWVGIIESQAFSWRFLPSKMKNARKRTKPEVKFHERALFVQICADANQHERSSSHDEKQRKCVFISTILLFSL